MNKKEYIIAQLGRTRNKKYEAYVVSRIIHLLDDFDIKFVTQQYVSRPEGHALIDLYFPQFNILVEVDEGQHKELEHVAADKIRDADIVNAIGNEPIRIDATATLDQMHAEIDEVVKLVKVAKSGAMANKTFVTWDLDAEFNPETYIERGYIRIEDDVAFKTIKDACNCFGHSYAGYQKAATSHPDADTILWFPKLFPNGDWDNQISSDEQTIIERSTDRATTKEHVLKHLEGDVFKRVVFGKVKGNLGDVLYRFRGLYELDKQESSPERGLVWRRTKTQVPTFKSKIS